MDGMGVAWVKIVMLIFPESQGEAQSRFRDIAEAYDVSWLGI